MSENTAIARKIIIRKIPRCIEKSVEAPYVVSSYSLINNERKGLENNPVFIFPSGS